jgi:hypothetical protein
MAAAAPSAPVGAAVAASRNLAHSRCGRNAEHGRIGAAFPVVHAPAAAYAGFSPARACGARASSLSMADMIRSPHLDSCRSIQRSTRRGAPC